jgi:catechol 2,3-dioxygenase-like lactoylglutathione lyase family enzyme
LDHNTVETFDLAKTVAFYRDVLGMALGDRPQQGVNGAWMCLHGRAVVHLNEVGRIRHEPGGVIDHVAFVADEYDRMKRQLDELGVTYEVVDSRPSRMLRQLYLLDPNGVRIEVNFDEP